MASLRATVTTACRIPGERSPVSWRLPTKVLFLIPTLGDLVNIGFGVIVI